MRKGFWRAERGATIVEFALLAPVLLLVFLGATTAFDLFRTAQNVEKATFTIGDMLSRLHYVSEDQLEGMLELMYQIVPTSRDGGIRFSSVGRQNGAFTLNWSENFGENVPNTPLQTSLLPEIADGDSVLVTESFVPHEAMFAGFGFGDVVFASKASHRPRFVAKVPLN